jgi:alpha-galactosidase
MPQTWASDNTDPIERLKIQHGSSLIYPQSSISAHVSRSPNCSGHYIRFDTRFAVAFTGSFGYEFNPLEFSDQDNENIRTTAEIYKKYGDYIVNGDYYRLEGPYNSKAAAWCNVSKDKSVCIATYLITEYTCYNKAIRLKLRGIDKDAIYKDTKSGNVYSGAQLINYGIPVNNEDEYVSQVFYLEKAVK